ncbi:MAG: 4'-phosphopantetheinyl transferase superfamily protein [Solirubrobacterales bacterium]|nr:4'-phosphopantetheinyl transferase superfamily protein [Solirubrobacterales bacterium]
MTSTHWATPPALLELAPGCVDVWQAELTAHLPAGAELLSAEEAARAARFMRAADGARWSRARAILRRLLGAYLRADPRSLRLEIAGHGKPVLADAPIDVRFNLSHSGEIALYAFALGIEVGVDLERARASLDTVRAARRMIDAREADRLAALDPAERSAAFLKAWVRHEAAVKCLGTGIGGERVAAQAGSAALWVRELEVGGGAEAAVAAAAEPRELRCWLFGPGSGGAGS